MVTGFFSGLGGATVRFVSNWFAIVFPLKFIKLIHVRHESPVLPGPISHSNKVKQLPILPKTPASQRNLLLFQALCSQMLESATIDREC